MAKGQTQHITWFYKKVFLGTAAAKSLQSCPTLCDPIDGSPPGSPIPGILQARTLEWVAISFSYAWKWKVQVKLLSHVRLLATTWTAAYQAPPSMGFSRQEYWSGVPLPSLFLGTVTAISVSSIASFFAWIIPWTEGPGKLQSMGLQRVRYNWVTNCNCIASFAWQWQNFVTVPQSPLLWLHKAENIYYLALWRKCLLIPDLPDCQILRSLMISVLVRVQ